MVLGTALIGLALAATLLAAAFFASSARAESVAATSHRRQRKAVTGSSRLEAAALGRRGRLMALAACLFVTAASVYLTYLLATHQFQFEYVREYSSKTSSAQYLLCAFWGGQEGSILLWALWTSVLGVVLARRARQSAPTWGKAGAEAGVWPIFAVVQSLLLVLVLVKSPFTVVPGPVPLDGQGLNPLLENQWMLIHPPVLFLGFASLAIPWAWAVYGLIYRDWDGWIEAAAGWSLFAFAVHGFGIALGGYWAYETLGWGGFWSWDPVENSSLVPWLFIMALLHGMSIQRGYGGFRAANFILAALPFAFMSYGTFLTRTGVLADFSVHSFSSLGRGGFIVLLVEIAAALAIPLGLLAARYRSIARYEVEHRKDTTSKSSVLTRESGLFLASIVLGTMAVITAVGMSAPLITKLWMPKGAAVAPSYYNIAMFPLAVVMLLIMAGMSYIRAKSRSQQLTPREGAGRELLLQYAGALALASIFFIVYLRSRAADGGHVSTNGLWMLVLFGLAGFVVIANLVPLPTRARRGQMRISLGGIIAHVGVAMVLAGIACLAGFSREALHISLVRDQPVSALGYTLTYLGQTSQPYDRANALRIRVEKNGQAWEANPHIFIASWAGTEQTFANPPDIHSFLWGDLYVAQERGPSSLNTDSPNNGMNVMPGDAASYGGYTFTYHGLKWSGDVGRALAAGEDAIDKLPQMRISARVDVTYGGKVYPIQPVLVYDQRGMSRYSIPAALPGPPSSNAIVALNDVQLPQGATLTTSNVPDPMEMVEVNVSTKPMIWLVWLGTLLYTVGGLMAYRHRANKLVSADSSTNPPADGFVNGSTSVSASGTSRSRPSSSVAAAGSARHKS